jgi:hypothetical protein
VTEKTHPLDRLPGETPAQQIARIGDMLEPNYPGAKAVLDGKYAAYSADMSTIPHGADHTDHNCAWFAINSWYVDWLDWKDASEA